MALLKNKKNPKIVKEIKDESLIAIYVGTKEWEKTEEKKLSSSNYNMKNKEEVK